MNILKITLFVSLLPAYLNAQKVENSVNIKIPVLSREEAGIIYKDTVEVIFTELKFDSTKHKIKYDEFGLVVSIDNKPVFGTDAFLPESELKSAWVIINAKKINLDVRWMYNPEITHLTTERCKIESTYYGYLLKCEFSTGAGIYYVEWRIYDNKCYRTVIDLMDP